VFYINARSYHWNIKGEKFFELHLKFEELYNDLFLKIDEVAERVLTLGSTPSHTYTQYLKDSTIQESGKITQGREAVEGVLAGYRNLLVIERQLLELSAEAGDEGTNALMSDYIRQQEKMVWMYSAFLG
jgi:starvation-inducible DNA-binding protein